MSTVNFNKVEFVKSAASKNQFIQSSRKSVIFAGKSNVGKSSVINRVLNRKNFAHVGNTPGKTIHVNYFDIDEKLYFIDLPGYGFANVSKDEKLRWADLIEEFFKSGFDLSSLCVLIVDSRHKPTADDIAMAQWFKSTGCRWVVLANKTDKLKKSELESNLDIIRKTLELSDEIALIPFSAEKGTGRELLVAEISKLC